MPADRSAIGRRNKRQGAAAEAHARDLLLFLGLAHVQVIETPWRVVRQGARIVSATPVRSVAGDIRAVIPGSGRSVLAEVKRREERLVYSDLEDHQVASLNNHAQPGGLSLLVWIAPGAGAWVMQWPIFGFVPRSSLTPEAAQLLALQPRFWLPPHVPNSQTTEKTA